MSKHFAVEHHTDRARSIVAGTAGHIDHGKTALVFALTGTDTDRLPEEKTRGITIDLGFAAVHLKDAAGQTIDLSLVDVPGHHAFIRNMLAGTGGIDLVLLVIAADEGVKAQTQEHLTICTLLGVRHGIVVITKRDAVSAERLQQAQEEARRFVQHTFLEHAPMIAVSALTREGIPQLKEQLLRLVEHIPARSNDYLSRLPLDRSFSVRGFGAVVTGTLQSGCLRAGNSLDLQPGGTRVRVRGLQVHGQVREHADAPCRVALNLSGIEVAEVSRGDTLVPQGTLAPVSTIDAEVTVLPGTNAFRHRARVRVHAFTQDALARVLLFDADSMSASGTVLARLRLETPMLLLPGDRFVIRQCSPAETIAGGRVVDAHPLPRQRKAATATWLASVRDAGRQQQILLRALRRGLAGVETTQLIAETGLTRAALKAALAPLLATGKLVGVGQDQDLPERFLGSEFLQQAMDLLARELERAPTAVSRAELRSRTVLLDRVFELAVQRLAEAKRVIAHREHLSLPNVTAVVDERLARVEQAYAAAGLASPIVSEVSDRLRIPAREMHAFITALLRAKKLVRMGADNLFVHSDAIDRLANDLRTHRGESFDVARFKSFTGLTRKHAIPMLEHLDRMRVTRNQGGVRVVL